jgi:hypothetical protein
MTEERESYKAFKLGDMRSSKPTRERRGHCIARGCTESTNDGKAYCLKHITKMPYVGKLMPRVRRWIASCRRDDDGE